VRLTLHDGEALTIAARDVSRVCQNLWRLAPRQDAVFLYGVVTAETRSPSTGVPLELTAPQSVMMREAVAMLNA